MTHKFFFEAINKSFCDIPRYNFENIEERPFGGKKILLGGDFHQIPLVVPRGRREQVMKASIKTLYLWKYFEIHTLSENMRLKSNVDDAMERNVINKFGN